MSVSILSWYRVKRPDEAIKDSLERLTEETGFLPLTSVSETGICPVRMSIPMSFTKDTAGKEDLILGAVIEVLKFVGEKEDLFAVFPLGATIQDGGMRDDLCYLSLTLTIILAKSNIYKYMIFIITMIQAVYNTSQFLC